IGTVSASGSASLLDYLKNNPPTASSSSTDWSRKILAITAANQNPYSFNGTDYINGLSGFYTNNQIGNVSADNDDMFAVLAFVAGNMDKTNAILTDTVTFILNHQHADGGFSYATDPSTESDIDDTAAAIMALQAAKTHGVSLNGLDSGLTNAQNYMLSHQNSDGGFAYDPNPATSFDTSSNISTTSWVMMALSALNAQSTSAYTNAQGFILTEQQPDGSFPYEAIYPPGDTFDSSYAIDALTETTWPLHIFAGTLPTVSPTVVQNSPTPTPTLIPSDTSANNSPTNTPTPTPSEKATQPTVISTTQSTFTTTDTAVSPTDEALSPTQAVLGAKTTQTNTNKNSLPLPQMFLGFGIVSLSGYGVHLFLKFKKH
ncbi:MAG: prenyltransferase/squalene oxidase repeat-containing protein, partial [Candidatus Levyibacteriota bacterium]